MVTSAATASGPILGPGDWVAVDAALDTLGMTRADAGFAKDHAEYCIALPVARELLADPFRLAALGDRFRAAAADADPAAFWSLAGELLDARPAAAAPAADAAAAGADFSAVPDATLRTALARFAGESARAAALVDGAMASVRAERGAMAASELGGAFDAEDRPATRAAMEAAGIAPAEIERAIAEGSDLDPEPAARRFLLPARRLAADARLGEAARAFEAAVRALAAAAAAATQWPAAPVRVATPAGAVVVGTRGDDAHRGAALLVLDPAGDDRYGGGAGAANGLAGAPLAAVVDLAGDDRYSGEGLIGPAGALFGVAMLLDADGRDTYEAAYAGLGAGLFGAAVLEDRGGDDTYRAGGLAQGAGVAGVGVLRDLGGRDLYEVGWLGQGYAGPFGLGLLADSEGNDVYVAGGREPDWDRYPERFLSLAQGFSIGRRPFGGGGVGVLVDRAGDDVYVADVYGQGASYWYSAGLLLDEAGDDTYTMFQYGQGSGIHLSAAMLWDGGGDDAYSGYGLLQGDAHDFAAGILIDRDGRDSYTGFGGSNQGRAVNNSFALLLDAGGDDAYFAADPATSQAIGDDGGPRESGSIALLVDAAGRDRYACGARDGAAFERPSFGVVYDAPSSGTVARAAEPAAPPPPSGRGGRIDSPGPAERRPDVPLAELLRDASLDGDTPERVARRAAARDEVFARRGEGLRGLLALARVRNMTVQVLTQAAVERLPAAEAAPVLLASLSAPGEEERATAAYFLGWYDEPAGGVSAVRPLLAGERTCGPAVRTLGKWRAADAVPEIACFLGHSRERVRVVAANALRDIGDAAAAPALVGALGDPAFPVRACAARALARLGDAAVPALAAGRTGAPADRRRAIARTLGAIGTRRALRALRELEADPDPAVRAEARRARTPSAGTDPAGGS